MKQKTSSDKTVTQTGSKSQSDPCAGQSAISVAPPAYGIDFVDSDQAEVVPLQRSPGMLLQAKLKIGPPGDKYEREADQIAKQVMSMPEPAMQRQAAEEEEKPIQAKPLAGQISPLVRRQPEEEEEEVQKQPEDDETAQAKAGSGGPSAVPPLVERGINSINGGGRPLPESTRAFFEPRFGVDFSGVRIHKGQQAVVSARAIVARAFTTGQNIVFGSGQYAPETSDGKKLLAHELTHVVQQRNANSSSLYEPTSNFRRPISLTKAQHVFRVLNTAQVTAAINYNNARYDERSIRIIQIITGTNVDGVFGPLSAQAVAAFQLANGLVEDGQVGENTLNVMVPNRVAAGVGGRREHAIQLVVDFYNLDVTSDTLSVHFAPGLATAGATAFEPGNLRVITVGPAAFLNAIALRDAIAAELAAAAPVVAPVGPRPTHLTTAEETAAVAFNQRRFQDPRSVLAIQGLVGAGLDGVIGADTVERIAELQSINGLTVDGKIGDAETLPEMAAQLIAANNQTALIRVILDFFNIGTDDNLLDVFFDPTVVTTDAVTDFRPNEPVRVRVGPSTFAEPFGHMVQIIAHEFVHVRRLKEGIVDRHTHEFLGFANEIATPGLPPLPLETVARGMPGFVFGFAGHARIVRGHWNLMPLADRQTHRLRFIEVRNVVRARVAAGTAAQQALHAPEVAAYNATVVPPP